MTLCAHAEDWLTLSFLPGLGCVLIGRLVDEAGGPVEALGQLTGGSGRRDRPGRPSFDRGQWRSAASKVARVPEPRSRRIQG